MNKLLYVMLLMLPAFAFAQGGELKSFEKIMDALKAGEEVSAVFYYGECQLIADNEIHDESVDAIGGMKIRTWEYFAEGAIRNKEAFVVASTTSMIANPKGEGFVHNYVKIKISASGKVRITAKYVDPVSYEETMTENFFTTVYDGKEGAAHFFGQ